MTEPEITPPQPLFTLGPWTITGGTLTLLLLGGLFIAFGWPTANLLAGVYGAADDYSHGFVIPLVSLYAAWEIRKQRPHGTYSPSWWGVPLLLIGGVLVTLGIWYRSAFLLNSLGEATPIGLGLFLALAGLVLSCGGRRLVGDYLFPLGFLAFCIPWPERITIQVTGPLRILVSEISALIVRSLGIWIEQTGNILRLTTCTLGVADACSGIRSLWVMLATAVALGYFLRCSRVQTVILMALSIPLAVLFNIIRVVATVLLVVRFGPRFAEGSPHEMTGGIVYFCGVVTLVLIGCCCAWWRQKRSPAPAHSGVTAAAPAGRWHCPPLLVGTVALLLILGTAAQLVVVEHYRVKTLPVASRKSFTDFPNRVGRFVESEPGTFVQQQLDTLKPSDQLSRIYRSPRGSDVNLWTLYWEPYRGSTAVDLGPHSPDGCYPAAGWRRTDIKTLDRAGDILAGRAVNLRLFTRGSEKMVLAYYSTGVSPYDHSIPTTLKKRFKKLRATWHAPEIAQGAQYVVVVQAMVKDDPQQTLRDVTAFLRNLAPVLPQFGI